MGGMSIRNFRDVPASDIFYNAGIPYDSSGRLLVEGTEFGNAIIQGVDNAIPNSALEVWQENVTYAVAGGVRLADFWLFNLAGAARLTVARSTTVPTVAQAGFKVQYSILCDVTTVDTSLAAGDTSYVYVRVPGYRWAPFAQRALTLSFWVNATKVGIYCCALSNSAQDRSCVAEYTVNAADTWEFKTVTFPASPTAGTWDYTTGVGANVIWALASGTTRQASAAGAWETGAFICTSNQVNATDSTANNFLLAIPKLEAGSAATAYVKPSFESVLEYARRFYRKSFPYATVPAQNTDNNLGAVVYRAAVAGVSPGGAWVPFNPTMNAAPVMTYYSVGEATTDWYNITDTAASGASSSVAIGEAGVFIGNAQLAVTDGIGDSLGIHYVADARL